MTRPGDDPARFPDALEGSADPHQDRVVAVAGGVVRAAETHPGRVATAPA